VPALGWKEVVGAEISLWWCGLHAVMREREENKNRRSKSDGRSVRVASEQNGKIQKKEKKSRFPGNK